MTVKLLSIKLQPPWFPLRPLSSSLSECLSLLQVCSWDKPSWNALHGTQAAANQLSTWMPLTVCGCYLRPPLENRTTGFAQSVISPKTKLQEFLRLIRDKGHPVFQSCTLCCALRNRAEKWMPVTLFPAHREATLMLGMTSLPCQSQSSQVVASLWEDEVFLPDGNHL